MENGAVESLNKAIMPKPATGTAAGVLAAIKQMNSRQKYTQQPIGLDTLSLVLNISSRELGLLITELEESNDIVYHSSKVRLNNGTLKGGSVSLVL